MCTYPVNCTPYNTTHVMRYWFFVCVFHEVPQYVITSIQRIRVITFPVECTVVS